MAGLTDRQQAAMVFISTWLVSLAAWAAIGFPTSRTALGVLVAALLIGTVLAIKEAFGVTPAVQIPSAPAQVAASVGRTFGRPYSVLQVRRNFRQYA